MRCGVELAPAQGSITLGDQLWKQQRGTWTIMWYCLPTYVVVLAESVPVPVSVEDAQGPFSREEVLRDVSYPQELWQCCRVPCRVFWWQERAADEFLESLLPVVKRWIACGPCWQDGHFSIP